MQHGFSFEDVKDRFGSSGGGLASDLVGCNEVNQ